MKNLRYCRKIDLATSHLNLRKLTAKALFKSFIIFHEELVTVERNLVELLLNRLIYVGLAILNENKLLICEVHISFRLHQAKIS